jgi:hypothetical protein
LSARCRRAPANLTLIASQRARKSQYLVLAGSGNLGLDPRRT